MASLVSPQNLVLDQDLSGQEIGSRNLPIYFAFLPYYNSFFLLDLINIFLNNILNSSM